MWITLWIKKKLLTKNHILFKIENNQIIYIVFIILKIQYDVLLKLQL